MLKLLFGFIVTAFGLVGTFLDPVWGVITFSLFTHITPLQLSKTHFAPLRIPLVLALCVFVSYLVSSKYPRKFAVMPKEFWLMVIMLIGMFSGSMNAIDPVRTQEWGFTFLKFVVFFLLFVNIIDSLDKIKWFEYGLITSSAWLVYRCWDLRGRYYGRFENADGGVIMDSNAFAAAIVLLLPIVVRKVIQKGRWYIRCGAALGVFGMIMTLVIAASRGAFLGFLMLLIGYVYFHKKSRKKIIILSIIMSFTIAPFINDTFIERMRSITEETSQTDTGELVSSDGSASSRLTSWKLAWDIFKEHPIFGCGIDNFSYYMGYREENKAYGERGHVTHSLWFQALSEGGIVVFVPLVLMLWLFFHRTRKICKMYKSTSYNDICEDIYALKIGMLGFLVSASFINRLFYEPIYWWCGLAVAHYNVANMLLAEKSESP